MMNKGIISKLKEQAKTLIDHLDCDGDKIRDWVDKTKIYIWGLWLDKKDDNFRKEVINMLEECKDELQRYNTSLYEDVEKEADRIYKGMISVQFKLRNVLESFIEVLELREKDLRDEKKQGPKKTTTKKKSD